MIIAVAIVVMTVTNFLLFYFMDKSNKAMHEFLIIKEEYLRNREAKLILYLNYIEEKLIKFSKETQNE